MKKSIKYLLISLATLLVAVFILAHLLAPSRVDSILREQISQALEGDHPGLYIVETQGLRFSLFFTKLVIPEISVNLISKEFPDTLQGMPRQLMEIEVADLKIATGGLIDFARKLDNVEFSSFSIEGLKAVLFTNPNGRKEEKGDEGNGMPDVIHLRDIAINNIDLEVLEMADTTSRQFVARNTNLTAEIRIQDKGENRESPLIEVISYSINTAGISYYDELYKYGFDSMQSDDNTLRVTNIAMNPLYGKKEFSTHLEWQTDRIDLNIENLEIQGISLTQIINDSLISFPFMMVKGGNLEAYRDKNVPFDTSRRPPMPSRLINSAPFEINIREIAVENLDVFYSEFPESGDEAGTVPFRNINASITNLTNITDLLQVDSLMTITATTSTVGNTKLDAKFDYNLKDINGGFTASVQVEEFGFEELNNIIYPLAGIKVDKGVHKKSSMFFAGNDFNTEGELEMEYYDLGVVLEPDRSQLRRDIVEWAARSFAYHTSNPSDNEDMRTGTIDFERDNTRFVFHYWWNIYLSGIKSTVLR